MKLSISGKSMFTYGIVLVIVISLTFWFSYWGTVGPLQQQLKDTNLALLKQIDQKLGMAFQRTEEDLLQLSNELEFVYFMNNSYKDDPQRYANFYALNNTISTFMNRNRQFSSIYVYSDISGEILTEKTFTHKDMSENKWLTEYLDMEGYSQWLTTHRIMDGSVSRDVVTLIRPFPALSVPGFRKGLLAMNMTEDVLYQMLQDIFDRDFKGHVFILDRQGNVVTHDDKSKLYSNMKEQPFIQKILSEPGNGSFSMDWDGAEQSVFYKSSTKTEWKIVSMVPESQVYQPLAVTRNLLFSFAAGMFLIAFVLLFYVNRWTFKPVDRMFRKLSGAYHPAHPGRQRSGKPGGMSDLENILDQMFQDREQLENQVRDSKPMLKWRTIMDILIGYRTEYKLVKHHLEFTGVRMYPEWFVVSTCEIGKEGGIEPKDETLYTYAMCNVAEEIINRENAGAAVDLGGGSAAILFSFQTGDEGQNHLRATALLEQILDVMHKQIGLTVTAGVGRCYREMVHISKSYEESRQALKYKMVTGSHTVISIEDLQSPDNQDYYRIVQMIGRIQEALKQSDTRKMQLLLQDMFQEAVKVNLSPDLIRQFSFELVMRSMQTVESIGVGTDGILARIGNMHERITQCENWKETEQLVGSVLKHLSGSIENRRNQRGKNDTMDKILVYVREHYRDSGLSLDRLADEFDLNPTYISKLFKEHAEGNFIDYLIEIRMQASQELLKDTSIKIVDISEAVGYTNSRSFMRTFKKYTGLTPTEYRDRTAAPEHTANENRV